MDEVENLQAQIKRRLKETGKSRKNLAEMIFAEDHDDDNDEKARAQFVESFKKQLNRPTTPPEKLQRYLEILLQGHRGLEVRTASIASSYLDKATLRRMEKLSREIEKMLEKKLLS